jgi:nitroreductase
MKIVLIYLLNCLQDFARGLKYNYNSPFESRPKRLFYQIIITSHTVEKGLSLAKPRPGFGREKIEQLIEMLRRYDASHGLFPILMARGALQHYLSYHRETKSRPPHLESIEAFINESRQQFPGDETGGLKLIEQLPEPNSLGMSRRFSCRSYTDRKIPETSIQSIVTTAQRAPSQCNRQSTRVHCYQNDQDIQSLLRLQGGSAGFAESVRNLFVVTSELTAWGGPGQRSQAYVDGGLFSMCLQIAIVEQGLCCCPLNLAVTNRREAKIAEAGHIPLDQRLILMIAFGESALSPLKAAASPRLEIDQVLEMHDATGA